MSTVTQQHDAKPQPSRHSPSWTLVLAGLGVFMTALDNLVVTTALPIIRASLHASVSDLEWTVNAYLLAFACSLLTGAALGDRFGRKRVFGLGLALFTAASAAAALAPAIGILIGARAVQGLGAAMVMPLSLTLVSEAFPPERRAAAIGVWGGIVGLAAAGPVIGGVVVEGINWHWIFWVNVPVGIVLIPLSASHLSESFGPRQRLDIVGLFLAAGGSLGMVWGLVQAPTLGWRSTEVLAALVIGGAIVIAFVWWEQRAIKPMVSLGLFRSPRFSAANAVSFCMYAGLFGALFLMSQFLQTAQDLSPLETGLRLLPWTGAAMMMSPVAGKLAERYGTRPFMALGLFLQGIGLAWIAGVVTPHLGYPQFGIALTVSGIGAGLVFPTVSTEVLAVVPQAEVGVASGTNSALRELGGVFGVAVLASVFARSGVYASPEIFTSGFKAALWVGAAFSGFGVLLSVSTLRSSRRCERDRSTIG